MWLTSLEDRLHSKHEASSSIPTTKSKNSKLFHLPKCTASDKWGALWGSQTPCSPSRRIRKHQRIEIQHPVSRSFHLPIPDLSCQEARVKVKDMPPGIPGSSRTVPWPQQLLRYNWMGQSGFNSNPWRGEASKEPTSSWELTKAPSSRQGHQGEKHQCQIIFHSNQGTRAKWRNCLVIPRSDLAW